MDRKKFSRRAAALVGALALSLVPAMSGLAATTAITPGVKWSEDKVVFSGKNQLINKLDVDLNDPYTTVEYGVSNPIQKKAPVTSLAKTLTYENHHVVGAVNASFFHMSSGYPAFLLAKNNKIENLGSGGEASTGFMYVPAAFGLNGNNQAQIDRFTMDIKVSHQGQTFNMNGYNRVRENNESILYTSGYSSDYTKTNPYGLEVVVTGLTQSLDKNFTFGSQTTGKVASIREYGTTSSSVIPADGFVLSATGTQTNLLRNMKVGDEVSVQLDIDSKWKNSKFMLASGPLLVQGGKTNMTIDSTSPRATARTSRTAIAIDQTGKKVFMVTVDSKLTGIASGMTMKEFADYLVTQGAYQAINLDGGGSTTMVARIPWDRYASLVNKPSEGTQRYVSAILSAVSTAPYGEPAFIKAEQAQKGNVAVGASVGYTVTSALDLYRNVIGVENITPELSVEGGIGTIVDGKFLAQKAGSGAVVVKAGRGTFRVPVTVESTVQSLSSSTAFVYVGKNGSEKITLKAVSASGSPLIFNQQSAQWSVSGNLGTVAPDGTFTAGDVEGKGTITATYGGKTVSIPLTVSDKPYMIEALDSTTSWTTDSAQAKTSVAVGNSGMQKQGTGYLQLNYDFTGYTKGTAASYLVGKSNLTIPAKPIKLGMWVHGDGKKHWLRGTVVDAKGTKHTVNFTEQNKLDWYGWRFIEATVPSGVAYPISLERVYVVEPLAAQFNKGSILLDEITAIYKEGPQKPYFSKTNATKVSSTKEWTVTFNTEMSKGSVSNSTIYIEDEFGVRTPVSVSLDASFKKAIVKAPTGGYEKGKAYQLVITKYNSSTAGRTMLKDSYKVFQVE
ncbi:phosphodiester glycosidase family protein [Peribacillus acanthi]|uniref:phosphodiester glycosidase family protein n=1 Tax=Peribacillus acanthi TaxID=2171554 RepID=UPI000D3E990D|nr:phosphodiester glycosidase family protein [Peribacillus acanthi]